MSASPDAAMPTKPTTRRALPTTARWHSAVMLNPATNSVVSMTFTWTSPKEAVSSVTMPTSAVKDSDTMMKITAARRSSRSAGGVLGVADMSSA